MSVCPYVSQHVLARVPLDAFSWNLILRAFKNICRETKNYIKTGQKCQTLFIWAPKYVSLLPAIQIRKKAFLCALYIFILTVRHIPQEYTQNALLRCHCKKWLSEVATMLWWGALLCCSSCMTWIPFSLPEGTRNCMLRNTGGSRGGRYE
jgi:hypothetical protein